MLEYYYYHPPKASSASSRTATPSAAVAVAAAQQAIANETYDALVLGLTPEAYWQTDESSGNLADATGNGWTATAYGSPTYEQAGPTLNGTSLGIAFQGGDEEDEFSVSEAIDDSVTTGMTVSFWFKTSTADQGFLGQYGGGATSWYVWINGSGTIELNTAQTDGSTTHGQATTGSGLADGAWHHVCARLSGGDLYVSVDGGAEGSDTSPTGTWNGPTTRNLNFGAISAYYDGTLAKIAYWDSDALTSGQRAALYTGSL